VLSPVWRAGDCRSRPLCALRRITIASARRHPVVMIDVFCPQAEPFGKLTQALDQLEPGDIYLASGGDMRCAYGGFSQGF
jgi:hypothetical protein